MARKRSKSTKGIDGTLAKQILRYLRDREPLRPEDVQELLRLNEIACTGSCKANRKDDPRCLCTLVPAVGSHRKKGLWQKEPSELSKLGKDPSDEARESPDHPCGLNNLGNTCYVNSALQLLFALPPFRRALYRLEPALAEHSIVRELRDLFLQLHLGPKSSADPSDFVKSLSLDHTVQQDGQEFLKLLLTMLESKFSRSSLREVKEVIPSLFRGTYCYRTMCGQCQRASEGSSRVQFFYELPLQVQSCNTLHDSLMKALEAEHLSGDNQYLCEYCHQKVDATRQMVLGQLPPYLCLSLQRFVFNYQTMDKMKATSKLQFPLVLDLDQVVAMTQLDPSTPSTAKGPDGANPGEYELMAVLVHKGTSASHGHYVAHVRHLGQWYRYDDETVEAMGQLPTSHPQDHGTTGSSAPGDEKKKEGEVKKGAKAGGNKRKRNPMAEADRETLDLTGAESPPRAPSPCEAPGAAPPGIISSNAYMLVYQHHQWAASEDDKRLEGKETLPTELREMVEKWHEEFKAKCKEYETVKELVTQQIASRQNHIRAVLSVAPVAEAGEEATEACEGQDLLSGNWVNSQWLEDWANEEVPPGLLDNSTLLCPHGQLDPSKVTAMKYISHQAWQMIQDDPGGGPALSCDSLCATCVGEQLATVAAKEERDDRRLIIMNLLDEMEKQREDHPEQQGGYYISKEWLRGWRKRLSGSISTVSPTANLTCPHGGLLSEAAGKAAQRFVVSPEIWQYFKQGWELERQRREEQAATRTTCHDLTNSDDEKTEMEKHTGEGDEPSRTHMGDAALSSAEDVIVVDGGSNEIHDFPVRGSQECPVCCATVREVVMSETMAKKGVAAEKDELPQLAGRLPTLIAPGQKYYLIPSSWMKLWHQYIQTAGTSRRLHRPASPGPSLASTRPPPLPDAIQSVLCSCHPECPGLTVPPPKLLRTKRLYRVEGDGLWSVVSENEFETLLRHHRGSLVDMDELKMHQALQGITAYIEELPAGDLGIVADSKEGSLGLEESMANGTWTGPVPGTLPADNVRVVTHPPVCRTALQKLEDDRKEVELTYDKVQVMVEVIGADELTSAFNHTAGERRSKRARKGRTPIIVSSSETLRDLKYKIYEQLDIHPRNANVYVRGQKLEVEEATLHQLEVYPDEEIRVVDQAVVDNDNYMELFGDDHGAKGKRTVEHGFKNTKLHGILEDKDVEDDCPSDDQIPEEREQEGQGCQHKEDLAAPSAVAVEHA